MKKKKTDYLSYIEDTKKHHGKIEALAISGVNKAIKIAKDNNFDITYLKGENIVKESSSGKITIIDTVQNIRRKVIIGSKAKLLD